MVDPATISHSNYDFARQAPIDRIALGIGLRLGAMAMLSIMFVFVKLASQNGVHVAESIFWRQLAGLPAVAIWLWWNNDLSSIRTARPVAHALRMILGLSGMLLNFLGMTLLPLAHATTIGFATPIFATLLAATLLRETTGVYRWGAVLIGFVGVLIATRPSGEVMLSGSMIALGGAIMTAAVTIQLRRMSRTETTGAIVFWFSLNSLIPLSIAMIFFGGNHPGLAWFYIAGLSLSGAAAQILLTSALRHAPIGVVLTMDYSSLIWATMLGFFVFGDIPGESIWMAAPIIISAGMLITWREQHLAKRLS
jgi:drug/metabolite transporter (DMT)-like permease